MKNKKNELMPTSMKNPIEIDHDVSPLGLLDIFHCVKDLMNLTNLQWLLYDPKRSAEYLTGSVKSSNTIDFAERRIQARRKSAMQSRLMLVVKDVREGAGRRANDG